MTATAATTATTVTNSPSNSLLTSTATTEPRRFGLGDRHPTNQFRPVHDNNPNTNLTPTPVNRPPINNNILALQEKFQVRSSPVNNNTNVAPSPIPTTTSTAITTAATVIHPPPPAVSSTTIINSPSTTPTPTTTVIQTNKHITVQEIDTTKYEEIPAKEPDLSRQPEKSALKKANGIKRRVIPVLREEQRPSPRPSPKFKPVVLVSSPLATTISNSNSTSRNNDEHNSDYETNDNDHMSSEDDNDDDDPNEPKKRFANVKRNDSLARFLKDRPLPTELFDKHILVKPADERRNERENIETKLERKLSLRPTHEELEARNILRAKTQAELIAEKEETKRYLIRKLSFRPSVQGKSMKNKNDFLLILFFK